MEPSQAENNTADTIFLDPVLLTAQATYTVREIVELSEAHPSVPAAEYNMMLNVLRRRLETELVLTVADLELPDLSAGNKETVQAARALGLKIKWTKGIPLRSGDRQVTVRIEPPRYDAAPGWHIVDVDSLVTWFESHSDPLHAAVVLAMAECGLPIDVLATLRWGHYDLVAHELTFTLNGAPNLVPVGDLLHVYLTKLRQRRTPNIFHGVSTDALASAVAAAGLPHYLRWVSLTRCLHDMAALAGMSIHDRQHLFGYGRPSWHLVGQRRAYRDLHDYRDQLRIRLAHYHDLIPVRSISDSRLQPLPPASEPPLIGPRRFVLPE